MAHTLDIQPAAQQQPIRRLSPLDCAAILYGQTALYAAWEAQLADVPLSWLALDHVVLQ